MSIRFRFGQIKTNSLLRILGVAISFSGGDQHRWELEIGLKPIVANENYVSYGNLIAHRFRNGISKSFTIPFPQYHESPAETYPGLALRTNEDADGQAAVGATQFVVVMDGIANNITVTYRAGLFFTLDGDSKVYMIAETFSFNEFETATLKCYPAIQKSTGQRQDINLQPVISVKYQNAVDEFRLDSGVMNESISVIEAL